MTAVGIILALLITAFVVVTFTMGEVPRLRLSPGPSFQDIVTTLGVEPVTLGDTELVFEGVTDGIPFVMRLNVFKKHPDEADRWNVKRCDVELAIPLPGTFRLGVENLYTPETFLKPNQAIEDLQLSLYCQFSGDVDDARAFITSEWRTALNEIFVGNSLNYRSMDSRSIEFTFTPWFEIAFEDTLKLSWRPRSIGAMSLPQFTHEWPELLRTMSQYAQRSTTHGDIPRLLSERAMSSTQPLRQRWRALRTLFERAPESKWATPFLDDGASEDPLVAAARFWTDPDAVTCDDITLALNTDDEEVAAMSARLFGEPLPWEVFTSPGCPSKVREELVASALDAAPTPERDTKLVDLLLGELGFGANRRGLFNLLTSNGWSPSPDARATLARDGVASIRNALIRDLHAREVTADDAPMLAALLAHGHEGDVAPYVSSLKDSGRFGAGRLSLAADDATRGALTASAGAHGLSLVDEEGG